MRSHLELVIEDLRLARSFWRNAAASKAQAIFTEILFEWGGLQLPTRDDAEVQNLASSAWSNGGFRRALSVSAKRDWSPSKWFYQISTLDTDFSHRWEVKLSHLESTGRRRAAGPEPAES